MKIAVCMPNTGLIKARCAQCLNELVAHTLGTRIRYNDAIVQPKFAFFYEDAGPLEYKRTRLALAALDWGADYHLLIDWDHTFPPDALLRLAAHDLPFVGTNYLMRHDARLPAAQLGPDRRAGGRGLQRVGALGLGFCLIKPAVFNSISRPWFQSTIADDGALVCGEDSFFCNKVREAGIAIHVDHDVVIGHIAETVLTISGEGENADSVLPSTGT